MVSSSRDRNAYVGGVDGAPPIPPPGGYRAVRRTGHVSTVLPETPEPRVRPGVLGWAAVGVASLLGLVLLGMWAARATDAIYGVAMLAVQLAVVVTVVAALASVRNRTLGSIAVAIVLLLNVGTIGAASAIGDRPAAFDASDPEDEHWAGYPGIKGQDKHDILERMSLEDAQRTAAEVSEAIRERLTAEFGFDWVQGSPESIRAERNGYGGASMLVQFTSVQWATTEPVREHSRKLAAMAAIEEVLLEHDFFRMVAFNDPASGFDPSYLERFYGSADVRTQVEWEWYSDNWPGPMRFYANITDLNKDVDGTFRAAREGQVSGTDEPLEGLRIGFLVPEVLSEGDVEEFERRMAEYGE